ncbi:Spy/CpxP family protein refolding chaperone [Legionella bononiensis]|uniref:Spy/CpxP family protein refolding chaperone n=1 Tax=Legionella bononiensis TaxID=2793102 RepID=A0ABS1W6Y7_9GAMM|nr:Spy/CpxP family protein refolding chaperone [Legionella bononiensis]MBL7525136.1 Spy/CpxP family protein refolding chaperone [Legionella bononiensis]MBL7562861.1 Spy/CpxP family protein refolding chaperone [Legionella bononiensis]
MYKKFLWMAALVCSLVLSQSSFSDSWGCGEGLKSMLQTLKLDDEQKAKIKPILDQQQASMKDLGTQMNVLDTQIDQQINATKFDQSALDELIDKKAKLIGSMIKSKIKTKMQIYSVLSADQKTDLQNMMKKLEDKIAAKFKSCHQND